jgi:hypothetical protein
MVRFLVQHAPKVSIVQLTITRLVLLICTQLEVKVSVGTYLLVKQQ